MKYNVGDKVRIKSIDWYNENKDKHGYVPCREYDFVPQMSVFCGKILTIDVDFEDETYLMKEDNDGFVFTIEMIEGLVEEETKPKFKVGDRVITNKGYIGKFEGWVSDYQVRVLFPESGCNVVIHPKDLKLAEEMSLDKAGQITDFEYDGLAYTLPEGYRFIDENGNEILTSKIILKKKKKDYPKTYEKCCKIMQVARPTIWFDYDDVSSISKEGDEYESHIENILCAFRKLRICRDAYWKLAGEEMGLGKPWEPSDSDYITGRYCIFVHQGNIICSTPAEDCPFTFPTEEMRDAFKENFDSDLEICKELL